jgi:hypothetical protein
MAYASAIALTQFGVIRISHHVKSNPVITTAVEFANHGGDHRESFSPREIEHRYCPRSHVGGVALAPVRTDRQHMDSACPVGTLPTIFRVSGSMMVTDLSSSVVT